MKTLESLASALGPPQALRKIDDGKRVVAAIARWRHGGARIRHSGLDTAQLVFNVSGGQLVELRSPKGSQVHRIRAGSVAVVAPGNPTGVFVSGKADTVQILVTRECMEAVTGTASFPDSAQLGRFERRLQRAGARGLVALAHADCESSDEFRSLAREVASIFRASEHRVSNAKGSRLADDVVRGIDDLIDERLRSGIASPPSLREMADLAGFSVFHFVRAFRRSQGHTPYARVMARRIDMALSLVLQTNVQVNDVAENLGFASASHFISAFRNYFGVTPGALRDAALADVGATARRAIL